MPIRLHALLITLLMSGASGCMTADMWDQASLKTVSQPHIVGSLADDAGRPGAVIVAYDAQGSGWISDRPAYAVVRLNGDGSVPAPFGCRNPPREWTDVVRQIDQAQADQILAQVFTEERWAAGKAAMKSPRFHGINDRQGVTTVEAVRIETRGLSPVAFWPGGTGLGSRFDWTRALPPNGRVMVLPNTEPRPNGDRTANVVEAAALTPDVLAADVVIDPIGYIVWISGGASGGEICAATPASPARKQWRPPPVRSGAPRLASDSHLAAAVPARDDRGT